MRTYVQKFRQIQLMPSMLYTCLGRKINHRWQKTIPNINYVVTKNRCNCTVHTTDFHIFTLVRNYTA